MIKTKLISRSNSKYVEESLNDFISSKISNCEQLIDIKLTETATSWSVLVIYKEIEQ